MSPSHTLRTSRLMARAVLLWWCLALGLATVAPLAQAQGSRMVCSASGTVMLVNADTGAPAGQGAHSLHSLDCALCLLTGAPPTPANTDFSVPTSLTSCVSSASTQARDWRSAAPPPGRGPPAQA
jgi:hypothetical protein